jgi:hypothetical protein
MKLKNNILLKNKTLSSRVNKGKFDLIHDLARKEAKRIWEALNSASIKFDTTEEVKEVLVNDFKEKHKDTYFANDYKLIETIEECFNYKVRALFKVNAMKFLKIGLKEEIVKLKTIEDYHTSEEFLDTEDYIIEMLKTNLEYSLEDNARDHEYCLKATSIEIYEYYLSDILPRILKNL